MDGLREEDGVDAPGACPGEDIGQHPQAQATFALHMPEERAIDLARTAVGRAPRMERPARGGKMP